MGNPAIDPGEHFTYGHYRTWPDDERWELIDGVAYNMSPAANRYHQGLLTNLFRDIAVYLEGWLLSR